MGLGKQLIELRKKAKLSQEELSGKVGIHANVLGRYEREEARPSIETAAKLADVLGVSLDYLVGNTDVELDKTITDRILTLQKLPEKDREHILFTLDAMLRDAKTRLAYA